MKFLFLDPAAIHIATAQRVAKDGNEVVYWNPYFCPYPKFELYAPGVGVPGIEKVQDWGSHVDAADVVVFPYVGMGDLAHWLRSKGKKVFGAGAGERCEQDRVYSTEVMKRLGVKYPETWSAEGFDDALELLERLLSSKAETNQIQDGSFFIKFDDFRGTIESFPVESIDQVKFMFESLTKSIGPYTKKLRVIVQRKVEGVETGADIFVTPKGIVYPSMWGFESSNSYIGTVTQDLSIFKADLDRLQPYFKESGYHGAFSFECIYDGKDCYWIDMTCRFPHPLGLMYAVFCDDLGKLIHDVASDQVESSGLPEGDFIGCMELASDDAVTEYLPIKGGDRTAFARYMADEGKYYSVPSTPCPVRPCSLVGIVCGQGKTVEEVEQACFDEAEQVEIYLGKFNGSFAEDIREEGIEPLEQLGVKFEAGESQVKETPAAESKLRHTGSRAYRLISSIQEVNTIYHSIQAQVQKTELDKAKSREKIALANQKIAGLKAQAHKARTKGEKR